MSLPAFAPFPPANVLKRLLPDELEDSLEAWVVLSHGYLLLPKDEFSKKATTEPSLIDFLISYMHENSIVFDEPARKGPKARSLKANVFSLAHRTFLELLDIPPQLLDISFLESLCLVYSHNSRLTELFTSAWGGKDIEHVSPSVMKKKSALIRALDINNKNNISDSDDLRTRTVAVLKVSFRYGQFLMVGSDFLDVLIAAYAHTVSSAHKQIIVITYLCLTSLMHPEKSRLATLIDHLYGLESNPAGNSLLRALCSTTPFLRKFRRSLSGREAARGQPLLERLSSVEPGSNQKPKRLIKRRIGEQQTSLNDHHANWITQITQVQDLFPDLSATIIAKLLDEYEGDVEKVTARLLDNPLPTDIQKQSIAPVGKTPQKEPSVIDAPQPPTVRRSVFDDDDFSRLAISPSQIRRGGKLNDPHTADTLLSAPSSASHKNAILSALATFDADDDERDDTYDAEDVGGTVDSALPGTSDDVMDAEGIKQNVHEETLWQSWKMSPQLFARDPTTRRSQARVALRNDTGMTDEAIEGWAIMLQRDPKKIKRLEAMFSMAGSGQQRALGRSAWQNSPGGSGTETGEDGETDGDAGPAARGGRGAFRGRGRGRGGSGRGGNVAGPADDRGTQVARQRKDANKGSRANHNRRDQRARKMARGGFAG